MSSTVIEWPQRLLDVVKRHLEAVENASSPSIPPLLSPSAMTIDEFLTAHQGTLAHRLSARGVSLDVVEFAVGFTIEVLEHACQLSFLTPKERRTIGLAVRQMGKRTAGPRTKPAGAGGGSDSKRTRNSAGEGGDADDGAKYCRVLTLEYLLRFFVALPLILDHYDRLGGSAIPAFSKRPLWAFASETLRLLDSMPDKFSPLSAYIPIK